jgi:hypothetical protein
VRAQGQVCLDPRDRERADRAGCQSRGKVPAGKKRARQSAVGENEGGWETLGRLECPGSSIQGAIEAQDCQRLSEW